MGFLPNSSHSNRLGISHADHTAPSARAGVEDHFVEVFPQTGKNPLGGRPGKDFELSRYACYLIAQNASSRLKPVAFAQTYFAIQTRRQELTDREGIDFDKLSENQKRLYFLEVAGESDRLAKPGLNAPALPPSPQPSSAAKGAGWIGRWHMPARAMKPAVPLKLANYGNTLMKNACRLPSASRTVKLSCPGDVA